MNRFALPLVLASQSPRRRLLLNEMGLKFSVVAPDFDDAPLRPGKVSPYAWVMALACLKAWRVKQLLEPSALGTVLGADTLCIAPDGAILGQPRDADHARNMLLRLRNARHEAVTGVCLLSQESDHRVMFCDRVFVHVGALTDEQIEGYVASSEWRGKAGGYNLSERIQAGWPIYCQPGSDPATVMGLPVRRLKTMLL